MLGEDAFVTVWAEAQTRSLEQILRASLKLEGS